MIPPVHVHVAAAALLLDVRHFATCRELTIPTHYTSAHQRPKTKESHQTHTLSPDAYRSNLCAAYFAEAA